MDFRICNRSTSFSLEAFIDDNKEKKYQNQAKDLIYKIPVYIPVPSFIIYKKDLSDRLKDELADYTEKAREDILKTAVGRIFENINQRYFLQSVKNCLKWKWWINITSSPLLSVTIKRSGFLIEIEGTGSSVTFYPYDKDRTFEAIIEKCKELGDDLTLVSKDHKYYSAIITERHNIDIQLTQIYEKYYDNSNHLSTNSFLLCHIVL